MVKKARVAVILIRKGKILLALSKYNNDVFYVCPGGKVEYGETLSDAAVREIKEETNYDIKIEDLLYIRQWIDKNNDVLDVFFWGKIISGKETHLNDPDKGIIKKLKWVKVVELGKIDFEPKILIPHILKDYRGGFPRKGSYIV